MDIFGKGDGYRWMDAYILAWIVELATDSFCGKYLDFKNDPQGKTSAQMNTPVRAAATSPRMRTPHDFDLAGLDLLNVAKGLGELRDDYIGLLRAAAPGRRLGRGRTVQRSTSNRRRARWRV